MAAVCTCERYRLHAPDGTVLEGERVRDPNCREHGFPTEKWPAGHPLRRHMRFIDRDTGEAITAQDARSRYDAARNEAKRRTGWDIVSWDSLFRDETPREVEARLYRESVGGAA